MVTQNMSINNTVLKLKISTVVQVHNYYNSYTCHESMVAIFMSLDMLHGDNDLYVRI